MIRRTKIVATLGPACNNPKILDRLIRAGVDVVRINFSHGTREQHIEFAEMTRSLARAAGLTVGVLADLQGPKIRVGRFEHGKIRLEVGDQFILDANCELGNQERVGLDYKELPNDLETGATLMLDDGRIVLGVSHVKGHQVFCVVEQGGILSNNKGINRKGGGLGAPALTSKDLEDIKTAAELGADYLAVSFVRSGDDIRQARALFQEAGGRGMIMAKIERSEAILALDDILEASDAIMVARGDLAVEVGDAAVPALQKRMIRSARANNKTVVTATQMMESMITNPIPTRAEVSDVANAVLDGTDAVMLSAESAAGEYPVEAVEAMARVCLEAGKGILGQHRPADAEYQSGDYRRSHCPSHHVHCQRLTDSRHRRTDTKRCDRVVDVAQKLQSTYFCVEPQRGNAQKGDVVQRCISGGIRRRIERSGRNSESGRTGITQSRCGTQR